MRSRIQYSSASLLATVMAVFGVPVKLRYTSNENGSSWINGCTGPDPDCPGNSGDITD